MQHDRISCYILIYNATCANYTIFTYRYAFQYYNIISNPTIILYYNRICLKSLLRLSFILHIESMIMIIYLYILTKDAVIAYINIIQRNNRAIVVKKYPVSYMYFRITADQQSKTSTKRNPPIFNFPEYKNLYINFQKIALACQ